ncbi:Reverse transcriptase-like [Sesbania bispinosa]|nr:Reverse transcriptase-like [Sesbania bispinosa]
MWSVSQILLDALRLVQQLDQPSSIPITLALNEVHNMLKRPWEVVFVHVFREANAPADFLAHKGNSLVVDWHSWERPPVEVDTFLLVDSLGASGL